MAKSRYLIIPITYLLVFLSLGFILGTFVLEMLIRSVAIYIRLTGWLSEYENIIVISIIIFGLFFNLLFAKWLTIWMTSSKTTSSKITFIIIMAIFLCLNFGYWFMPGKTALITPIISVDGRFTAGPYPDAATLSQLKTQGFTTVISLLDPLVLPDEALLIYEEQKAIAALDLKLIRIPLLPGNVDNLDADKKIILIATSKDNNKYYVHSNRDQDRIVTFMNIVDKFNQSKLK